MSSIPSWLWLTAGWCAIALGAWLLVTGRRRWARKHGRRCRACGYDMGGLTTMLCPECGRTAASERELLRLPSRMRWRLAGAALMGVGWLLWQTPALIAHGWAGGVPGWVLVRWAPTKTDAADATTVRDLLYPLLNAAGGGVRGLAANAPLPPPPMGMARLRSDLYLETWRRVHSAEVGDGQAALYLRRLFNVTPESLLETANLPPTWPSDRALPELDSIYDATGTNLIPAATCRIEKRGAGSVTVLSQVHLADRSIIIAEAVVPLDMQEPAARFMRPVDSQPVRDELVRTLQPSVSLGREQVRVEFTGRNTRPADSAPCAVALKVRLLSGDRVLAIGTCDYEPLSTLGHSPVFAYMRWEQGAFELAAAQPQVLELELTGVPRRSLRDYLDRSTKLRDTWSGSMRIRPRLLRDAE